MAQGRTHYIWVVLCDDDIMGIYPNDKSKAEQTLETLIAANYNAKVVKFAADEGSANEG